MTDKPRAWARPAQVTPGSGVAAQVDLMRELTAHRITGPDFARSWLDARRIELAAGERVRDPFERVLRDVFYLLDDYVIDPELRGPEDITDTQLTERVREALEKLNSL